MLILIDNVLSNPSNYCVIPGSLFLLFRDHLPINNIYIVVIIIIIIQIQNENIFFLLLIVYMYTLKHYIVTKKEFQNHFLSLMAKCSQHNSNNSKNLSLIAIIMMGTLLFKKCVYSSVFFKSAITVSTLFFIFSTM